MRNTRTRDGFSKNNRIEYLSSMTILKRIVLFVGLFIAAFLIYQRDVITGDWKFRALCELEGGARYYEVVEKNAGWMMAEIKKKNLKPDYYILLFNPAFFRYKDTDGEEFDMTESPYSIYKDAPHLRYKVTPSDSSKSVRYLYTHTARKLSSQDDRFSKIVDAIIDLKERKVVASYTNYIYYWRTKRWLIFPPSPGVHCPKIPTIWSSNFPKKIYESHIESTFKNKK